MVYQFKVTLKEIEPAIWRRILVPTTYSFWEFHVAVQDSMGWLDYHLHEFKVVNPDTGAIDAIGIPDDEVPKEKQDCMAGWEMPIAYYFRHPGDQAEYEYDFGDGWEHQIVLEGILLREQKTKYPKCIGGDRSCPPEDCGGVPGYEKLVRISRDPAHKEYQSMKQWLGSVYDPDAFDFKKVRFDNPRKRWKIAFNEE